MSVLDIVPSWMGPHNFSELDLENLKESDLYSIIHMGDIDFCKFTPELLMSKFSWQDLYRVHSTIVRGPSAYTNNYAMSDTSAINVIDIAWMTKCKREHGENWLEEVKKTPTYIFYFKH